MIETLNEIWKIMHVKAWVVLFLTGVFLHHIYRGYFKQLPAYFKTTLPWFPKIFLFKLTALAFFIVFAFFFDNALGTLAKNAAGLPATLAWEYGAEMGRSIWIFLFFGYMAAIRFPERRNFMFGAILSTALTGLSATVLKHLVLRARPEAGEGPLSFFNFDHWAADSRGYQSFPSGDVSIVAGACFFLMFSTRNPLLKIIFFVTPFATAFARMRLERHWFSDTWMASAIALGWAFFIYGYQRWRTR